MNTASTLSQEVVVHCDYSEESAIAKAIVDGNFDRTFLDLHASWIPLIGSGEVDHEVCEDHSNKNLTISEAIKEIVECGYEFATPFAALRYAVKLPDRQREYPLSVLFKINYQLWALVLLGDARVRFLRTRCSDVDAECGENCRFLVVRKQRALSPSAI